MSMQLSVYNQKGEKVSALTVSAAVFGVAPKPGVLHQAVVAQRANARVAIANTKQRGEIRGGGKKPWKQKGTGRARHGSIRSPIWRGGGIVFGPRSERNFEKKINQKVKRSAILMALSDKVAHERLLVVDEFSLQITKTKAVAQLLGYLPIKPGRTMFALHQKDKALGRLATNIERVTPIWVGSMNVVDLLRNTNLVTTVEGIKEMERIYGAK